MGIKKTPLLRLCVDLGVMAMKGYSTLPRFPELTSSSVSHPGHPFSVGVLKLSRLYSQRILSSSGREEIQNLVLLLLYKTLSLCILNYIDKVQNYHKFF